MKLNRKWLNEEFVDLSGVPDREFVETMTIAGQKVETYERLDAELRNVVVGRVVSITRHDELRPHVGLPDRRRRRRARADRHRRTERTRGRPCPRGPAQFLVCPAACTSPRASCAAKYPNGMLCSLKELGLTLQRLPLCH